MNTEITCETEQSQKAERKLVMDVQDITKSLPLGRERIAILKGISFQIMNGEFVSIVGPSGSGKSTLLGIIAGLDNPTTGQVLIDSVNITRMTEGKLAVVRNSKIGMVFQAFNLIPTLTAQETLKFRCMSVSIKAHHPHGHRNCWPWLVSRTGSIIVPINSLGANSSVSPLLARWQLIPPL